MWTHYGDLLAENGEQSTALNAYRTALELIEEKRYIHKRMLPLLRATGNVAEALIRAEALLEEQEDLEVRQELLEIHKERGDTEGAEEQQNQLENIPSHTYNNTKIEPTVNTNKAQSDEVLYENRHRAHAEITPESDDDLGELFQWDDLHITFDNVAGLEAVKKQINLKIIAPIKNPQIYEAFHRSAGGGILLYGPPGCGKTYIAKATAGECKANFVSVSIHDIVDKYWGESEKVIHLIFEEARRKITDCTIF